MAPRSSVSRSSGTKPPRSKNALVIAASAISRSLESPTPSCLSTLRLIADALLLCSKQSREITAPLPKGSKTIHDPGFRALANAAVSTLLTLPSTNGPLHRRAMALLYATATSAGAATLFSAAERARAHLKSLRSNSIAPGDLVSESAFTATCRTLAHVSRCGWAGRAAAEQSSFFLLRIRGSLTVRAAAAHAAGIILESFPVSFAPDPDILSLAVEVVASACATSNTPSVKSVPKVGFAYLASALAPRLISRPENADKLLRSCLHVLPLVSASEKGIWAAAAARLAILSRTTRSQRSSRIARAENNKNDDAVLMDVPPAPTDRVFEGALVSVARIGKLSAASPGCVLVLVSVLRAWAKAIPANVAVIPSRAVGLLAAEAINICSASSLRDSVVVGVIQDMEPSASFVAVERLLSLFGTLGRVGDALVADLCAYVIRLFGKQALLTVDSEQDQVFDSLFNISFSALETNYAAVRLAGVRLISAIAAACPDRRASIVKDVLKNLRMSDFSIRTNIGEGKSARNDENSTTYVRGASRPSSVPSCLSSVLGHSVALALLVEETPKPVKELIGNSLPLQLIEGCGAIAMKLLNPLMISEASAGSLISFINSIRRRAGWAIITGLSRAHVLDISCNDGLRRMFPLWAHDLSVSFDIANDKSADHSGKVHLEKESAPMPGSWDEALIETAKRSAALAALHSCLAHSMTPELRKFAQYILGGCAAKVALVRVFQVDSNPGFPAEKEAVSGNEPLFYRASLNSPEILTPFLDPESGDFPMSFSVLGLIEMVQIAKCVSLAPPIGNLGDICYFALLSLGEDAQKALMVSSGALLSPGVVAQLMNSFSKSSSVDATFTHRRKSLCTLKVHVCDVKDRSLGVNMEIIDKRGNEYGWIGSTEGVEAPVAEEVVVLSAEAIASIVTDRITKVHPGIILRSLASATALSPALSSVLALSFARRIRSGALGENGAVLAMMQVLVGRSLKSDSRFTYRDELEKRDFEVSSEGSRCGTCIDDSDLPGAFFESFAQSGYTDRSGVSLFPVHRPLRSLVYHCGKSRSQGITVATRVVTAKAYHALALKGGIAMWCGLTKSATNSLNSVIENRTAGNVDLALVSCSVLGSLLHIAPQELSTCDNSGLKTKPEILQAVTKNAVDALARALDFGDCHIRAASALALSPNSSEIAFESERLMAALARAWATDRGVDTSHSQVFRCAEDVLSFDVCLDRICNRVVAADVKSSAHAEPYMTVQTPGSASLSCAVGAGVSSVLASTRLKVNNFSESATVAGAEVCADLLDWHGEPSLAAQAAGLHGLREMWTQRIASGRLHDVGKTAETLSLASGAKTKSKSRGYIPIHMFSLLLKAQTSNSVRFSLEDVLYNAFSTGKKGIRSDLHYAAMCVLDDLLKHCGLKAVCSDLKRLPEVLFDSFASGFYDCIFFLEKMAGVDVVQRPRYWIGLCRAVVLGGLKLNTGSNDIYWDVNARTRQTALRILRIAVTASLSKCECGTSGAEIEHTCVLGCLKETLEVILTCLRIFRMDARSLCELCGMLKVISAFLYGTGRLIGGPSVTAAIEGLWVPIASSLGACLSDESPLSTVRAVAESSCQWLLLSYAVNSDEVQEESGNLCAILFGNDGLSFVTRRFQYLEENELGATLAIFSVLESVSELVSKRCACGLNPAEYVVDGHIVAQMPILKTILSSVCVDYAALQGSTGRFIFGTKGCAMSFKVENPELLSQCYVRHMPWILVCVNALAHTEVVNTPLEILWCNQNSAGARLVWSAEATLQIPQLCSAQLLLLLRTNRVPRSLFDPYQMFRECALISAKVMMRFLHIEELSYALMNVEEGMQELHDLAGLAVPAVAASAEVLSDKRNDLDEISLDFNGGPENNR